MKIKGKTIVAKLRKFCPEGLALPEDSTGWQIENQEQPVQKVFLALDPSFQVIKKAIAHNCQLLLTHHPLFWPDKLTGMENPIQKAKAKLLVTNKIGHYNLHTNYDQKYLNLLLAQKAFEQKAHFTIQAGYVLVELETALPFLTIWQQLQKSFSLPGCQYWKKPQQKLIKKIALAGGAGGFLIELFKEKQLDLLITGEMKWNQWILARDYHQSVITIGHHLEALFIKDLKEKLKKWFPTIILLEHWEKAIAFHF